MTVCVLVFLPNSISIISQGLQIKPVENLDKIRKFPNPTMLSLGALRAMKRTYLHILAFERAKKFVPNLRLLIAGDASDNYGQKVLRQIKRSRFAGDISYLGRVDFAQKQLLMQRSHILVMTSVKEGWGLVVSEAASQGTPAVVYDVDGLRDSVQNNTTGLVVDCSPKALAAGVAEVLSDTQKYGAFRLAGWRFSQGLTLERSYQDFLQQLSLAQPALNQLKKEA